MFHVPHEVPSTTCPYSPFHDQCPRRVAASSSPYALPEIVAADPGPPLAALGPRQPQTPPRKEIVAPEYGARRHVSKGSVSSFLEDLISFHLGAISSESDEREASLELYNEAVEEFVTDMVAGKGEVPPEEGILVRSLSQLKALTLAQADMLLSQEESESMAEFEKDEPQDDPEKEEFENLKQKVAKATQILKDTHAAKQKLAKNVSLKEGKTECLACLAPN